MNKRDTNHPQNIEEAVIVSHINNIMTSHVVKVTEVNTKEKTVNAEIMVRLSDGENEAIDYGPLNNIPYARLQGGGYGIICDPQVGDIGIVVFSARDFSNVKKTKTKTIPASNRTYDIADGIYIASLLMSDPSTYIKIEKEKISIDTKDLNVSNETTEITSLATISVASQAITITAPSISIISEAVTVTGIVTAQDFITTDGISLKSHTHTKGDNGGPTGKPIGG